MSLNDKPTCNILCLHVTASTSFLDKTKSSPKIKRTRFSIAKKVELLDLLKKGKGRKEVCQLYSISPSTLFRCVLASLYEVVSVGPMVRRMDGNPSFLNAENEQFSL